MSAVDAGGAEENVETVGADQSERKAASAGDAASLAGAAVGMQLRYGVAPCPRADAPAGAASATPEDGGGATASTWRHSAGAAVAPSTPALLASSLHRRALAAAEGGGGLASAGSLPLATPAPSLLAAAAAAARGGGLNPSLSHLAAGLPVYRAVDALPAGLAPSTFAHPHGAAAALAAAQAAAQVAAAAAAASHSLHSMGAPSAGPAILITRQEFVNVFVIQPRKPGVEPRIRDVTILRPKRFDWPRVLFAVLHQLIAYSFVLSAAKDKKRVQSRRDGEVVKIKKFYLRQYLQRKRSGLEAELPHIPSRRLLASASSASLSRHLTTTGKRAAVDSSPRPVKRAAVISADGRTPLATVAVEEKTRELSIATAWIQCSLCSRWRSDVNLSYQCPDSMGWHCGLATWLPSEEAVCDPSAFSS
eukprot:PLAT1826.2.p1 GENE.PLAT1826.2~~PLAT1826.2.p1  ORF type:complete len:420 (+),score=110.14 PLAT1826.2:1277-2536(+)